MIEEQRATTAGSASGPGSVLSAARIAQNLTLADIARHLKLSISQVEALESGAYERLPGPVFVRGFVRNYARFLKMDPEEVLRSMGEAAAPPPPVTRAPPPTSPDIPYPNARRPMWPAVVFVGVVLIGLLAVYEFVFNEPESAPAPQAAAPAPAPEPSPPEPVPALATLPAVADPASTPTATPAAETPAKAAADQPKKAGERELRFLFAQDAWVRVEERGGRVLLSQLNTRGTVKHVRGVPPFTLVVGNSQGVKLVYDEKPVDLTRHTKVDVARFTLE
jgi:cytoskeleton protein RodZ